MNKVALENLQKSADELAIGDAQIKLEEWFWHKLIVATTNAVYGPGAKPDKFEALDYNYRAAA
jgi:hypothetical protein